MKLLLVKTSSLGDVVHAMPAITEAVSNVDDLELSWVVEEGYRDIASLHPGVQEVIPVALRRWRARGQLSIAASLGEMRAFRAGLSARQFDLVLDSQGLLKSALIAFSAKGVRHGFDGASARESFSSWFYQVKHAVPAAAHAVSRQKRLFAAALGYEPSGDIDYGLPPAAESSADVVLLHGTTWPSKAWPVSSWRTLARTVGGAGYRVVAVGGNEQEVSRAHDICQGADDARVLAKPALADLVQLLRHAAGVVSVDTGLGHLAAAFARPLVGVYGPTDPALTGMTGAASRMIVSNHLPCIPCRKRACKFHPADVLSSIYPPCFANATPETVWQALQQQIGDRKASLG